MNVIIIDDEQVAIDVLKIMLERLTQFPIEIKGTFTNVDEAICYIQQETIDIIFLDIEMRDVNGLQIAKKLLSNQPDLQIIFVTAHSEFAVEAFEVQVADYLLKPVHEKRLIKALSKVQANISDENIKKGEIGLYAHVLGSGYLRNVDGELVKWRTRKTRELFFYLWIHQKKPLSRPIILDMLWEDTDVEKASNLLNVSMYQLRKLFKENGLPDAVQSINNHYQLNIEIDSDYAELMRLLQQTKHDEASIRQLLNCYEGDFLAEEEYIWTIPIRQDLKKEFIGILESFISNTAHLTPLLKINCLQKLLELDEYNEHYMLLLLSFFIEQNKKHECIEYYQYIKEKLEEINVAVPSEIHQVYRDYIK
ncbi:response regulator [Bacillus ndiopicus]|uniref:response regulator n=1 Tax=Bacillus ndiopicus TaxID=1347368 RepID=UPI0005A6D9A1|nr:response regulator [Bacillus ndiopicus]